MKKRGCSSTILLSSASRALALQDQCRKGRRKLRPLELPKFGHEHLRLSLLTGIKIRLEWYFHVSFMLPSWASHGLSSTQREGIKGSSNKFQWKEIYIMCACNCHFITCINGLKAYTIKKGTSHKVSVSTLVEDYTFNSPERALLLGAFGIKEITIQIPRCLFTYDFFFFLI